MALNLRGIKTNEKQKCGLIMKQQPFSSDN